MNKLDFITQGYDKLISKNVAINFETFARGLLKPTEYRELLEECLKIKQERKFG